MAGKMFETTFYFLLEFCLVTSRHYLMFRWPVQIAKLRKWQEIKTIKNFKMQALLKKIAYNCNIKKLKTISLLLEIMQ